MELTKEQKKDWVEWLNERPENVRKVAEKIVPWKRYRNIRDNDDIGNRYRPISYQEHDDGTITVTCEKLNEEMPILGGYGVFGINPDNLIESDN